MTRAITRRDGRLYCEQIPVTEIVARYGTPVYVYSGSTLTERFRGFRDAFASLDPLIAYSVKANGNLSVLRLLASLGAGADIVSGGELHRAQLAGIPPERIVFSGVGKTVQELAAALDAGIYAFNVESEDELNALLGLADAMGVQAPVSLRINPDIESPTPHQYTRTGHRTSKFGIPEEEAGRLYRVAADSGHAVIRGIDVHIGSQIMDIEPYRLALGRVLDLWQRLRSDGIEPEFVDLGGGFGVPYEDGEGLTPADFAAPLLEPIARSGLRLVLEPGRYIAGPAGILLTRVLYVKEVDEKVFVITDAGMNDLLRPSHYASYHHVDLAEDEPRPQRTVDIVGPICETGDFLALDRPMPDPRAGELLAVHTAGAYGFSMASSYNSRRRPAEVLVEGGSHRLVRRRESYHDLTRGEMEYLQHAEHGRDS